VRAKKGQGRKSGRALASARPDFELRIIILTLDAVRGLISPPNGWLSEVECALLRSGFCDVSLPTLKCGRCEGRAVKDEIN
jgi:hypothetical protein